MRSWLACMAVLAGCASAPKASTLPRVEPPSAEDARAAFRDALGQLRAGRCEEAVASFDAVAERFADSRYVSASLYNAGLCLQRLEQWGASATRYERILEVRPGSPDTKHTRFQLAFLYLETQRFSEALEVSEMLEAHTGLTSDERSEIMARRAEALLGLERLDESAAAADEALHFYRSRTGDARVRDPFFAASAAYTLAETFRLRSEAVVIPEADVESQREVLESRAALLLRAQRGYFDAMAFGDPYWSSASGYRIGALYDGFWDAITQAPVPPPRQPLEGEALALHRRAYRARLAELARPLVRHAIRYWELTLAMVERTGVHSEWTDRIREDLARARKRMAEIAPTAKHQGDSGRRKQPG
ncbi:MAG: hypothetical protein AAGF92_23585 [Myxococcota bacterium]